MGFGLKTTGIKQLEGWFLEEGLQIIDHESYCSSWSCICFSSSVGVVVLTVTVKFLGLGGGGGVSCFYSFGEPLTDGLTQCLCIDRTLLYS